MLFGREMLIEVNCDIPVGIAPGHTAQLRSEEVGELHLGHVAEHPDDRFAHAASLVCCFGIGYAFFSVSKLL